MGRDQILHSAREPVLANALGLKIVCSVMGFALDGTVEFVSMVVDGPTLGVDTIVVWA